MAQLLSTRPLACPVSGQADQTIHDSPSQSPFCKMFKDFMRPDADVWLEELLRSFRLRDGTSRLSWLRTARRNPKASRDKEKSVNEGGDGAFSSRRIAKDDETPAWSTKDYSKQDPLHFGVGKSTFWSAKLLYTKLRSFGKPEICILE